MIRLIARLDIKGSRLIKGVQFEGVRVVGDPWERAQLYYEQGADELLYIDTVASLYGRNSLSQLLTATVENLFIPVTAGGGIRSVKDAGTLLRNGADKVAVNTAAVANPSLISDIAREFGSQAVVVSIQAKSLPGGGWEVYTDCGRERSGIDVLEWAQRAVDLGSGELLVTSIDRDGTYRGFDQALIRTVGAAVPVPVIACGGLGTSSDFSQVVTAGMADAVAAGSALHYNKQSISEIKQQARADGIPVRLRN